jgi:uncharacterized phage-associated protein
MGLSRSAKYYRDNPEARAKKNEYQSKYNKKKGESKRRSELNRLNRLFGTYGNGDKKDVSHRSGKKPRLEAQSKNRGSKNNTSGDKRARGAKKKK